jgi:hypothetical protein
MKNIEIDGRKVRMQIVLLILFSGIPLVKIDSELLLQVIISNLKK